MDLYQTSRLRAWFGKLGAILCLALFLALLDGLIFQFRQPYNILTVFPGTTQAVDGPLPEQVETLGDLRYTSSSPHLELTFLEVMKGFWMGGGRWRGELTVSPQAPPGESRLEVTGQGAPGENVGTVFTITVYQDLASFRQETKSMVWHHLGVSPWRLAVYILPFVALSLVVLIFLTRRMYKLMAQGGRAELYQVIKREGDYLVAFALGTANGIGPGTSLYLLDDEGRLLGMVEVEESTLTDSLAVARVDAEVLPGYFVSRQLQ
jgi:hypothetical protein